MQQQLESRNGFAGEGDGGVIWRKERGSGHYCYFSFSSARVTFTVVAAINGACFPFPVSRFPWVMD